MIGKGIETVLHHDGSLVFVINEFIAFASSLEINKYLIQILKWEKEGNRPLRSCPYPRSSQRWERKITPENKKSLASRRGSGSFIVTYFFIWWTDLWYIADSASFADTEDGFQERGFQAILRACHSLTRLEITEDFQTPRQVHAKKHRPSQAVGITQKVTITQTITSSLDWPVPMCDVEWDFQLAAIFHGAGTLRDRMEIACTQTHHLQ